MVLSDFFSNFAPKFIRVLILDEKSYCICGLYPRGGLSAVHLYHVGTALDYQYRTAHLRHVSYASVLPPVRFRVDNWRRYQGALSDSGKQVCDRLSDIFLRHSHNSLLKINIESKILANK